MMPYPRSQRSRSPYMCLVVALGLAAIAATQALAHDNHGPPTEPYIGPGWHLGTGGLSPVEFESSGVHLLSWIPIPAFGEHNSANACAGYVSPSGREYAIIGLSGGTAFVEVTDPANPKIVEVIAGPTSRWRDMKVYQHYCYTVSEGGGGIQVIDLAQIDDGVVSLVASAIEGGTVGTLATHTVALDEVSGYLYRCGGSGAGQGVTNGLRMYSLADPALPQFVGEWHNRYVHEAQVVTYTEGQYAGRQIAFLSANNTSNSGDPRLDILDVTDKSNPFVVGEATYSWPRYAHQSWLTEDRQYAYLNDELAEIHYGITTTTRIIDVSDLENPFEAGTFSNGNTSIGHNLYIRGNTLFAANYRSGLRVWDITIPLEPVEIGYFDTWPEDDLPQFNSLWDNYPFLPSGIVVGSDIEKGLFVWLIGDLPLDFSYPDGLPEMISHKDDSFIVRIEGDDGTVVVPGSAKLHYDMHDGNGFVEVELVPTRPGGTDYIAQFPSMPCATTVMYFVSAQSSGGDINLMLRDPPTAPAVAHTAIVATDTDEFFADDFDEDHGWTVGAPDDDATHGIWERAWPLGTTSGGFQVQPNAPLIGSAAYITGQHPGGKAGAGANDVDNGKTTLYSPLFRMSGIEDATVSYWRWYSNSAGANPHNDIFEADISSDGGESWVNMETVGPGGPETMGGWYFARFRVSDFVNLTDQLQVRFVASDYDPQALVEAAVDMFRITAIECALPKIPCPADLTGNATVGVSDLLALLSAWGSCPPPGELPCPADLDASGTVGVSDLLVLLASWGDCPK